eukprot:13618076-Alexandrium_andersonii.AAC.1
MGTHQRSQRRGCDVDQRMACAWENTVACASAASHCISRGACYEASKVTGEKHGVRQMPGLSPGQ